MTTSRQRRAPAAAGTPPEDGGFLRELILVDQARMLRLIHDAPGDKRAERVARAALRVIADAHAAAKIGEPKLCLCCPREITDLRFSAVVLVPKGIEPNEVVGAALCAACAEPRDRILGRAIAAFRNVWPDMRQLSRPPSPEHLQP